MATWPPNREADLVTFSGQYAAKLTLNPTLYGLVAAQCSSLTTASDSFKDLYDASRDDATRTPLVIAQKKASKAALVAKLRELTRIVEACPTVTDAMRVDLGIPVHDKIPSPPGPIEVSPRLTVLNVSGRRVKIRVGQTDPLAKTAKPDGVQGCSIFSYVGEEPSEDLSQYKFEGNLTRSSVTVEFPITVPQFSKVYLTAFWFSRTMRSGPACEPVGTNLGAALPMAA